MKTDLSAVQRITGAALKESANERKGRRLSVNVMDMELTKNSFIDSPKYYYFVSVLENPITQERFVNCDPDIKITKGQYSIQYIPSMDIRRNPKFPYMIGQDLVRLRVTVSGPRHWGCLCERIPELGWIQRNSTFRDELFAIAKKHPGLVLKFGVDFVKYCEKIESCAKELGIDIDHKPLFSYQWNQKVKDTFKESDVDFNKYKNNKDDYREVLDEVERSKTVQEEIGSIKKGE